MNSRERVKAALEFKNPDKIPADMWIHRATQLKYGNELDALLEQYPLDIVRMFGPADRNFYPGMTDVGEIKDEWGSTWKVLRKGLTGEVKTPALQDISGAKKYNPPYKWLEEEWEKHDDEINKKIEDGRKKGLFIYGGYVEVFQRMQFIRGTENLFCDMPMDMENTLVLRDKVVDYFKAYLEYWFKKDVDAVYFADDFGSQRSLLISPAMWREIFKPVYRELMDMVKARGKYIFYHTCGYVFDLYQEFIDLGVDAINTQINCMGLDKVAEKFAGKITFWGEMDRQHLLPYGTPEEIYKMQKLMKEKLFTNGGGLIGHSVAGVDVPIENIKAILTGWNR